MPDLVEVFPDLLLDWKTILLWNEVTNLNFTVLFFFFACFTVAYFIYHNGSRRFRLAPGRIVTECRYNYVLVTGCDSGFGKQLTLTLLKRGVNVFAGCFTEDVSCYS